MRNRLRTLLIVLALGPWVLACGWLAWEARRETDEELLGIEVIDEPPTAEPRGTVGIIPSFAFTTVTNTERPDGGDVLLGGIRRMRQREWWRRLTFWQPTSVTTEEKLLIEVSDEPPTAEPTREPRR
jgi:hypothetical protein